MQDDADEGREGHPSDSPVPDFVPEGWDRRGSSVHVARGGFLDGAGDQHEHPSWDSGYLIYHGDKVNNKKPQPPASNLDAFKGLLVLIFLFGVSFGVVWFALFMLQGMLHAIRAF